ncbi:MAG: hypothetical protein CMN74_02055, partial [Sphingorhabdus sp.]|nr:hypothetical protein [Sphingorhabdus sp.]
MNSEDDNQDQPNPTHDCVRRGQEDAQAQEERLEDPDDDVDLSREEGLQVRKRASVDSYVVHEVIR